MGTVQFTANFQNTNGSPSRGFLNYVHVSAPGKLRWDAVGDGYSAFFEGYQPNGARTYVKTMYGNTSVSGVNYRYWDDAADTVNIERVRVTIQTAQGTSCSQYLESHN